LATRKMGGSQSAELVASRDEIEASLPHAA
jgi:hypothetical protein